MTNWSIEIGYIHSFNTRELSRRGQFHYTVVKHFFSFEFVPVLSSSFEFFRVRLIKLKRFYKNKKWGSLATRQTRQVSRGSFFGTKPRGISTYHRTWFAFFRVWLLVWTQEVVFFFVSTGEYSKYSRYWEIYLSSNCSVIGSLQSLQAGNMEWLVS